MGLTEDFNSRLPCFGCLALVKEVVDSSFPHLRDPLVVIQFTDVHICKSLAPCTSEEGHQTHLT